MINIYPVPAFQDNYLWLFHRQGQKQAYVVDPGDPQPILDALAKKHLDLSGILITHHHMDHTGGIKALQTHYSVPVYGPDSTRIPQVTQHLNDGDILELTDGMKFRIIDVPGHTLDHIAYTSIDEDPPLLFCGDTLFGGGCGRLFEGSAEQMHRSLSKLAQLPANTLVCCAHEYTLANLAFAQAVEADNVDLQHRSDKDRRRRQEGIPTIPSTIATELATNPFMRCHLNSVKESAQRHCGHHLDAPEMVLKAIRAWKDNF